MKFIRCAALAAAAYLMLGSAAAAGTEEAACWSLAQSGAYLYIGTGRGGADSVYRDQVETTLENSVQRGLLDPDTDTAAAAAALAEAVFGPADMADPAPVIMAVHKTTGKTEVIFAGEGSGLPPDSLTGYPMAAEFGGKLYFAGIGSGAAALVEVDPASNEARAVYRCGGTDSGDVVCGIRSMAVCGEELLVCVADGACGIRLLASADPGGGPAGWREIADQGDFDDLPAVTRVDGLYGSGVWDMAVYNGRVYVSVVTDRDIGGQIHRQGFALYRGTRHAGGSFTWTQVVGDQGTSGYSFGLGMARAAACSLWVHGGYLYLGTCNDPVTELARIPETGDFEPLYRALDHSVCVYRMDEREQLRMVAGKNDNPCFPEGPIGSLGAGLGDHTNQAVCFLTDSQGRLLIGTWDMADVACLFTRITDGHPAVMGPESIAARTAALEEALRDVLRTGDGYTAWFLDALELPQKVTGLYQALAGLAARTAGEQDPVPEYRARLAEYEALRARAYALLGDLLTQWDFPARYRALTGGPVPADPEQVVLAELDRIFETLDGILYDQTLHHYIYYLGCGAYIRQGERGFDLLVSGDGIHFEARTRDGFGRGNDSLWRMCAAEPVRPAVQAPSREPVQTEIPGEPVREQTAPVRRPGLPGLAAALSAAGGLLLRRFRLR